ncbi:hypothetical protein [Ensifer sp. SSB1]|uniref:hypothetical protein n=1 Tax=Ensifer sp. SSB1 TaxID=2795385 RepID=UPI001A61094F|nr:hypothetical protein [Ensifer sp. SSB1]MBK5565420.1 hypothetical protein [Ensifer sp. SSB1]
METQLQPCAACRRIRRKPTYKLMKYIEKIGQIVTLTDRRLKGCQTLPAQKLLD